MKEILQKKLDGVESAEARYDALREGLQHLILKILDDGGYFDRLCFVGGTALRILYDIRRFSEDMDFSLQRPHDPRFDFQKMLKFLIGQLEIYRLPVDTKVKTVGAVRGVFLRFKEILQELKVVRRQGQKLAVKLEVDINPPAGARWETRIIQKDFLFSVVHHDLSTLFAGKLLAFLFRNYTKGRDMYDLIWHLSRGTPVNRPFFENGLFQSTGRALSWTREDLLQKVIDKSKTLKIADVMRDAAPFLDDPSETRFFDPQLLMGLVTNIRYDE